MPYAATQSRLSVLMLTDIVGSTDLKSRLGLAEYARRLGEHDRIFKNLIDSTPHAEILKDTGDGYFASFATTSDAVRVGLRFQQALRELENSSADDPICVRIGIHVGEVAELDEEQTGKPKIVGLAADLVSRVMHLAGGRQILLTRFAFNEARQFVASLPHASAIDAPPDAPRTESIELKWIAHGPYRFKGLDEPVEVFEVGVIGVAPLNAPAGTDNARRAVLEGADDTLGWRPAVGLLVPDRPHWELEKRLGEGGFGEVWLARHVTLGTRRVFKFCFDPDRLRSLKRELTLFRILQDALGDRPDIARIYEVKLDQPPYFLESEYTEGGNLQDWSDMEGGIDKISPHTRIDLVARVADAVSAAHSVGILHKDIKPSNILITIESGQPRPQLADFGIGIIDRAKMQAQAQPITLTGFTFTGDDSSQTGTRLYIPPEVLVGRPFTVQGDVYALGVLLYQMIVSDLNRPLAEGWERDVDDELLREDVAACVDGDPSRRLSSAADLSKRLRALDHRREWKRRDAEERRVAKRRRRVGKVAVGTAISLVVVLFFIGFVAWREWTMRHEAEQQRLFAEEQRQLAEHARQAESDQRAIADEVGSFLMGMMLSVSPDTHQGREVKMIDALDVSAKRLDEKQWHPEVEAYLRNTVAQSYRALGEAQLAEPHARRSVELIEKLKGEDHPDTHKFRIELGMILSHLGQFDAAEGILRDGVEQLRRLRGSDHAETVGYLGDYALVLLNMERNDEAAPILDQLVESHTRTKGPDDPQTLNARSMQAGVLYQRGQYAQALQAFQQLYETHRRVNGDDHALTLLAAHNYSSLLYRSGQLSEAIPIMRRVLDSQKRVVGPEHPRTLEAMLNLSQMLRTEGDEAGGRELLEQILEIRMRKLGPEHPDTLHAASMLGSSMVASGSAAQAEPLLRQTLELQRKHLPPEEPTTLTTATALAQALEKQGKLDDAEAMYRQCLDEALRIRGPNHTSNRHQLLLLGRCLVKQGKLADAEAILLEGLRIAQDPAAPNPMSAAGFTEQLVLLYEASDRPDDAARYRALGAQLRAATQRSAAE